MSHKVWDLAPNASGAWQVEFQSDPGIVLVQPQPEHTEVGHEHSLMYTEQRLKVTDGKWFYQITVTNRKSETAHFRIRWAKGL